MVAGVREPWGILPLVFGVKQGLSVDRPMGLDKLAPGVYLLTRMEGCTFREWLADALADSGETRRGLARKVAERHPHGVNESTIESARRTIRKILEGSQSPTQPTRDAIQEALGRDDAPTVDDEDEAITREMVALELDHMLRNLRRFKRALNAGAVSLT